MERVLTFLPSLVTVGFIQQEVREEEFRKQQVTNTELLSSLLLGSSSQQEKTEQGLTSINKQLESEGEKYERLVSKVKNMTGTLFRDVTDKLNSNSESQNLQMNQIIRKQEKTEQGLKSINKQMESEGERYERLVAKVNNVTGISETLLRDVTDIRKIFSNFKTDVNDKIDSLNNILGIDSENKTFQIANLSQQINTTSNDLLNLHLKIGNITTSLNSLEQIKQHLIDENQRMILKSENVSKENESTGLLLRNISEIYFTKLSNQSGRKNKEISKAIGRVFGSMNLPGNSLGLTFRKSQNLSI